MAHLIQLASDPQARSLSDYLTRLWSRKEKRVDNWPKLGDLDFCDACDPGAISPAQRLAWRVFRLREWWRNPPFWMVCIEWAVGGVFAFLLVAFVMIAVMVLWP